MVKVMRTTLFLSNFVCASFLGNAILARADWIDQDTPKEALTTKPMIVPALTGKDYTPQDKDPEKNHHAPPNADSNTDTRPTYELVFSDEFNADGRSFADGSDPKWTALDKNDYTNGALHYYTPNNVRTENGDLIIQTKAETTEFVGKNDTTLEKQMFRKRFTSSMLQTWNKFCFTGGIIEAEIQLPGKSDVGGLWPAFWMLGNIARHTYVGSTSHVWPFSSNVCTEDNKDSQKINGCMQSQRYGMEKRFGRGAPEIDVFEVQPGDMQSGWGSFRNTPIGQPFASHSFQVAPGRSSGRPNNGDWPNAQSKWYDGLTNGTNTSMNILFYGDYNHVRGDKSKMDYWSDAVSFNHQLNEKHFNQKFRYRVEWELPNAKHDGYMRWFINDKFVLDIDGSGIVDAGFGASVSTEPMYILLNTAVSTQWGFPPTPSWCPGKNYDCNSIKYTDTCGFHPKFCNMTTNKSDPPEYKVNWVRVWQNPQDDAQKVGCSTPERPTKKFIEANQGLYKTSKDVSDFFV